ncbi:hypothetical protein N0V88_007399 [Collariella sp. IMI 366227]|nr:hypothetical protein N0V88_007399 [Collariella sp. IMI 366227]
MARSRQLVLILLSCLSFSAAHHIPTRLSRPLFAPGTFKRATSSDPSCPAGFLCEQEPCPGSAICSVGEMCLNFEGTFACVPEGSSCHGQCYAQNAVCCDNPGTKCTLGKACNVCNPGQQCQNGGCSGDMTDQPDNPAPSTTTVKPTITFEPEPTVTTTLTPTTEEERPTSTTDKEEPPAQTTTKENPATSTSKENPPAPSTTIKEDPPKSTSTTADEAKPTTTEQPPVVTPSSAAATTTEPPKPTTVSAVGPFQSPICIQDFVEPRVLVNGSFSDLSENGITVEKCVELAQGWQYAGVEYGGECFWGDETFQVQGANQGDCSQPCSGNAKEICGNGNRMILYKDTTWKIPTRPDLGAQVQEYLELLAELQQLIQQWNDLIQQAISQQGNAKRQTGGADILVQVANARAAILRLQARWTQLTATLSRHFKTGDNYRILEEIEMQDLADIYPPVDAQLAAIATDAAIVANSGLNVVAAISTKAFAVLGRPRVIKGGLIVIGATGIFEIGFHLLDSLIGTGGDTPDPPVSQPVTQPASQPQTQAPTSTPEPTKTSTSTQTSSTCTYTEGPTPVIVVTKQGTTSGQFEALVKGLPLDLESEQLTDSWLPNWAYIGKMNRCQAEELWSNPIVEAMTLDRPVVLFEGTNDDPTALNPDAPITKRSETVVAFSNSTRIARPQQREVRERALGATTHYRSQTDSGVHLKWLSAQSNQRANKGKFYDFEDYLYDDRSLKAPQVFPPRIYIIDTAFLATHDDFSSRIKTRVFVNGYDGPGVDNSHGTCMTSIAAGSWTGVAKDVDIGLIEARFNFRDQALAISATIKAFRAIIQDVTDLGLQGNAVVSMSFAITSGGRAATRTTKKSSQPSPNTDAIGVYLHALFNMGVAAAASAGNYADKPSFAQWATLQAHSPRRNGGANSPLVVVGNADKDGKRYPSSNWVDEANAGILTHYMLGDDILCAVKDGTNAYNKEPAGTSQATAATAGLMAYFLSDPDLNAQFNAGGPQNMPMRLKQHLVAVSTAQKGVNGWNDPDTDHIPRLATGENVECDSNVVAGAPPVPEYVSPPQTATGRQLAWSEVSNGMSVVLPEGLRPKCYNRP